jgi:hypothetical protein
MQLFWRQARRGERLVLQMDDGSEEEIGGVRETKRGFDAFARTFGYDPGRAVKGLEAMDEGKRFVESFSPWELYGVYDAQVDPEVRPAAT